MTRCWYRHSVGRSRALLLVAVLGAGTFTAGCATAHSELGTSNGPCFIALPAALGAVHHRGSLSGVRLLSWSALRQSVQVQRAVAGVRHPPARACLVGFDGSFRRGDVAKPAGSSSGRFAVVVLRYPASAVVATVLTSGPPLHFGHSYLTGG